MSRVCEITYPQKWSDQEISKIQTRVKCGRQFIEVHDQPGYSLDTKALCLKMYVNGMGFRGISRVTRMAHSTIINWVRLLENFYLIPMTQK